MLPCLKTSCHVDVTDGADVILPPDLGKWAQPSLHYHGFCVANELLHLWDSTTSCIMHGVDIHHIVERPCKIRLSNEEPWLRLQIAQSAISSVFLASTTANPTYMPIQPYI